MFTYGRQVNYAHIDKVRRNELLSKGGWKSFRM